MPRTCGSYKYVGREESSRRPATFVVAAIPHVRDRFKRTFPGHKQNGDTGQIAVSATPANARDLKWFCDRWPLESADPESAAQMNKLADDHVNGEEQLLRILVGEVPDLVGRQTPAVTPRDYQLVVPAVVRARGFLLLGDDVGLGKTLAASLLFTDPEALPALVVAPTHLVDQWAYEELPKYYPWLRTHVARTSTPYELAKHRSCKGQNPHVLVMTYAKLYGWADRLAGNIRTVIFDEGDDLRTGGDTFKYVGALQIARRAKHRIIATATPVHNYADEMWNLVDLLSEGALGTKEEFRLSWGGKRITDPRGFGLYLRDEGIMLRRTREDVGRELPPVSQMIHPVETDHNLLKQEMDGIIAMAVKVLDTGGDRRERFTASGQLDMKVRQATGVAKAPYVAQLVRLLLESEEKIVLVGHHHKVYDIWRELLADFDPVFYTGAQTPKQKAEAKHRFIHGDARVFVMALRSGSGLNGLQDVCATQVFGEVDWSPARHKQVVGRLARDGQTRPVAVLFAMSDAGSDPAISDLVELKRRIAEPINDPDAEIVQPSKEEALRRVQALAIDLLRRHGIAVPKPGQRLPDPVPGSGELIAAGALARAREAADVHIATGRVLEGRTQHTSRPSPPPAVPATESAAGKCGLCGKSTYPTGHAQAGADPDALDCGGDCWGCVRDAEGQPATVPARQPATRDEIRSRLTGSRTALTR